jgi:hypothetical protein
VRKIKKYEVEGRIKEVMKSIDRILVSTKSFIIKSAEELPNNIPASIDQEAKFNELEKTIRSFGILLGTSRQLLPKNKKKAERKLNKFYKSSVSDIRKRSKKLPEKLSRSSDKDEINCDKIGNKCCDVLTCVGRLKCSTQYEEMNYEVRMLYFGY